VQKSRKSKARPPTLRVAAVIKPIVAPVVSRLDRHEELLLELKSALDIQLRRIGAIQAQIDHLIAASRNG
jgi:hypothetical protein